jgi:hypothetical protein
VGGGVLRTVYTYSARTLSGAARSRYYWNGKNKDGVDVRPDYCRMGLTATDAAGNRRTVWRQFRVVR